MKNFLDLYSKDFGVWKTLAVKDVNDLAPLDQQLEQEHQEKTKVKNIQARSPRHRDSKSSVASLMLSWLLTTSFIPAYVLAAFKDVKDLFTCYACQQ